MGIVLPAIIDDDGSGVVGSVLNSAWQTGLQNAINGTGATSTAWTPTDASGAGLVLTGVVARYTQIGPLVIAAFGLLYPSTASSAGAALTLPVVNGAAYGGTLFAYTTEGASFTGLVPASSSSVTFYTLAGSGLLNSALSGKSLYGLAVYFAT